VKTPKKKVHRHRYDKFRWRKNEYNKALERKICVCNCGKEKP